MAPDTSKKSVKHVRYSEGYGPLGLGDRYHGTKRGRISNLNINVEEVSPIMTEYA